MKAIYTNGCIMVEFDIAKKMREVLPRLKKFNGVKFPELRPEIEDAWDERYAIVYQLYYEYDMESDYFDHDRFRKEYEDMVRGLFPGCKVYLRWKSQFIEVYDEEAMMIKSRQEK